MSYVSEVLADNPDWYLQLNEPSGSFVDSTSNGIGVSESGPVTRSVSGPFGSVAITADGSDVLVLGYAATFHTAQTVEGWFRTSTSGTVVLEQNRADVGICLQLAIGSTGFGASAGQVTAFFNSTSFWQGIHTTSTVNDGAWHHIVGVWTGSGVAAANLLIYVDGSLASTSADGGNTGFASPPISGRFGMSLFNAVGAVGGAHATVDAAHMAFYSHALSAGRVADHYAATVISPPDAEFSATPRNGIYPLSVTFTDETDGGSGTPVAWLWDFGDGSGSTSQNPVHIYTTSGSFAVTLTVTTDDAQVDSVTHTNYISTTGDYVAPPPSNAVIEIYVDAPGSYRWDEANWDEAVYSESAWVDVTPQSVEAVVRWGSHQPERGILAETEAGSWSVDTYDPDRLMDPGNEDSPYATDLRAGLPIRIRHRGTIVRQGVCETIAYFHKDKQGGIRVTDSVSILARTPVPSDSVLSDTLRARARDAISAAGLVVTVEPDPPSGDPALAPRLTGDRSVWRHISDGAEQVLHIAYVDRLGTLCFRPYATPYDRGRGVDGTNLIDLGTIVQTSGLYSVVQVRNLIGEGDDIIERRLTPTPQYGSVTYLRDDATPDSDAWADAVLTDRSIQTVQWIPGDIYPLSADDVEYFALLESLEKMSVAHIDADPPVSISGTIIGGEFRVISKKHSEALWRFSLELAQTAVAPLVDDFNDPGEFLLNESEDAYLYAG